jgi:hypothetical protein
MTIKEMCEVIERAEILQRTDGTRPTAREIFNYSRTGELAMIWEWYNIAADKVGPKEREA